MPASKIKILVVEDDLDRRLYLANLLRAHGFAPLTAARATDVGAIVRHQKPSLIVLDAMLPSEAAQLMYAEFKSDPETCRIPVVLLSSLTRRELHASRLSVLSPHVRRLPLPDAFLPNPPEAEEFIMVVRRLTGTAECGRETERS